MTVTFQAPAVVPPLDGVKYVAPPRSETGCGGKLFELRRFEIDSSNSARVTMQLSDPRPGILAFDQLEVDLRRDVDDNYNAWNDDLSRPRDDDEEPSTPPTPPTASEPSARPPSGLSCQSFLMPTRISL